jgi:hypothetical protein
VRRYQRLSAIHLERAIINRHSKRICRVELSIERKFTAGGPDTIAISFSHKSQALNRCQFFAVRYSLLSCRFNFIPQLRCNSSARYRSLRHALRPPRTKAHKCYWSKIGVVCLCSHMVRRNVRCKEPLHKLSSERFRTGATLCNAPSTAGLIT